MLGFVRSTTVKKLQTQNSQLSEQIESQNAEIQNLSIDILTIRQEMWADPLKYAWNRETNYDSAISKIHDAYNCESEWGVSIGSMIDLRAGFVGGHGIEVDMLIPGSDREKAFVEEFLSYNGFDSGNFLTFLQDCEKEGKALLLLKPMLDHEWTWMEGKNEKPEKGMILAEYLGYNENQYHVFPDKSNSRAAGTVKIDDDTIEKEKFAYRRYRGATNKIDKAVSIWQRCIEHVISLEKAYADMRLINRLFSSPKPIIECETKEQAEDINAVLNAGNSGINFKTRKVLTLAGGKFKYAVPEQRSDLKEEIEQHRYAISFNTGIPVQFLGDPAAVRNKNVSENLMEGVNVAVESDRQIIEDLLNEVVEKAFNLVNGKLTPYNPKAVRVKIGDITAADWNRLISFWMPAQEGNQISQETFFEQIPGMDAEQEMERIEKEKEEDKKEKEENQDAFFGDILDSQRAEGIEKQKQGPPMGREQKPKEV